MLFSCVVLLFEIGHAVLVSHIQIAHDHIYLGAGTSLKRDGEGRWFRHSHGDPVHSFDSGENPKADLRKRRHGQIAKAVRRMGNQVPQSGQTYRVPAHTHRQTEDGAVWYELFRRRNRQQARLGRYNEQPVSYICFFAVSLHRKTLPPCVFLVSLYHTQ